jgi:ribulose-phosphate 3-epimerase
VPELAPSIISADFSCLRESLGAVEPYATSWHVDVMDGVYVPNLTVGPMAMQAIAKVSSLPQDVHVMISNVDDTWEWYAKAGARRFAFHAEVSADATKLAHEIRAAGVGPGLALNPDVPVSAIEPYLEAIDHVIVMSVFPGFSGQKFIPESVPKLAELRKIADERSLDLTLYIDGGVSPANAQQCADAGADVLISASAIFGAAGPDGPAGVAKQLAGF